MLCRKKKRVEKVNRNFDIQNKTSVPEVQFLKKKNQESFMSEDQYCVPCTKVFVRNLNIFRPLTTLAVVTFNLSSTTNSERSSSYKK